MFDKLEKIAGYSETKFVESYLISPKNLNELKYIITLSKEKNFSICIRGSGLSYADVITNTNNVTLDIRKLNKIINWDENNWIIDVQSGVSFSQLLSLSLVAGWSISSCPGSFEITIGGAISNNVHGKDSYSKGNFGSQILELKILLYD